MAPIGSALAPAHARQAVHALPIPALAQHVLAHVATPILAQRTVVLQILLVLPTLVLV